MKEWYVVNTVSGYEYKVKEKLDMMIKNSADIQESIFRVVVPEQTVVDYKDGVKKEKVKKMFPGYVLVEMIMSDEVWFIVRNTQGVTGFIGSSGKGAKPIPLLPEEVDRILNSMGLSRTNITTDLTIGNKVKINDGPFKDMIGKINSYDAENQVVEVLLDLFGQETPVEASISQIENI
ncbi:MAG: transcription termination/antitermination factor NusG [Bacilli bacterium]|nr:transcription termination/antitermination factor NusG [Bacilli bacterium]